MDMKPNRRQTTFLAVAALLAVLLGGLVVYLTVFLGSNLSSVFTAGEKPAAPVGFDIAGYEKLGLPK